jgi:tRNA (adenine37-N6)-methyltransferase
MNYTLIPIGKVQAQEEFYNIILEEKFIPGLKHIEGFSHLWIIWWAHLTDNPETRERVSAKNLFKNAPPETGVFSLRTPERPNPIMISVINRESIDIINGIITTRFIDAENGTPVLDIKPYFPLERIRKCHTPSCYSHWPQWAEDTGTFNWKNEISFDSR